MNKNFKKTYIFAFITSISTSIILSVINGVYFLIDEFLFRLDDTSLPNLEHIPVGFLDFIGETEMITNMFVIKLKKGDDEEEQSN